MPADSNPVTPKRMLLTTRVLWFALIAGQVASVMFVTTLLSRGLATPVSEDAAKMFLYTSWAMVVAAVPLGYFLRMQSYKQHWQADVITPQGYLVGNLLLWSLCEVCSLTTILFCLLEGALWPALVPALVALSVQVLNYPDGRPMFPPGATPKVSDAVE